MDPKVLRATLLDLCEISAAQTLPRFRKRIAVDNKIKAGFDPVTEADKAAEAAIRAHIIDTFPDHGILGEEEDDHQPDAEFCWIIDPIDGTRAFISGLPAWGTLIGLNHNGKPIAGAMHQPFTGETWLADSTGARFLNRQKQEALTTSRVTDPQAATLMTTDPFLFEGIEWEQFSALKNTCRLTRYGFDCYAYCMVAAGNIDIVMESGLNAYDIAPLVPIIENAGGVVTTWSGSNPANGGQILASANHALHEKALQVINLAGLSA